MTKDERNLFETLIEQNVVLIAAVNRLNADLTHESGMVDDASLDREDGLLVRLDKSVNRQEDAFNDDRKLRLSITEKDVESKKRGDKAAGVLLSTQVIRTVVDLSIFAALVWIIFGLDL